MAREGRHKRTTAMNTATYRSARRHFLLESLHWSGIANTKGMQRKMADLRQRYYG